VPIHARNQTLATVTVQNFFRLYPKICGLSGKAKSEEPELREIYRLRVISIPANTPLRRIEGAQKKVEQRNSEIRKNLLAYDRVLDEQRKQVYTYRQEILDGADCKELILEMIERQIDQPIARFMTGDHAPESLVKWVSQKFGFDLHIQVVWSLKPKALKQLILQEAETAYRQKEQQQPDMPYMARSLLLQILDASWKEHLLAMDLLRGNLGTSSAEGDPKTEYRRQGRNLFEQTWKSFCERTTDLIFRLERSAR